MLVGAVEEFGPQLAWANSPCAAGGELAPGEGAAVFVVEEAAEVAARDVPERRRARRRGRHPSPTTRTPPRRLLPRLGGRCGAAGCTRRQVPAVRRAGRVARRHDGAERDGHHCRARRRAALDPVKHQLGETYNASSALQLAALLR